MRCCVTTCKSDSRIKEIGVTFHRFPADEYVSGVWAALMGRSGWQPTSSDRICSRHFGENSKYVLADRTFLYKGSVPSLFVLGNTMSPIVQTAWLPELLTDVDRHKGQSYAIVVLNRSITLPPNVMCSLWHNAKCRVTVDGGTDRWLSFLNDHCKNCEMKHPDLISGDFDSVTKESINYFNNNKTTFIRTPDQNETDFTKALKLLKPLAKEKEINTVIVIQDTSGRFDHIMANINTLFKADKFLDDIRLYLLSGSSITWLLNPGVHSIRIPSQLVEAKRWCSLIPVGEKSIVSTTGLKWNLDNSELEFGQMVSTSNTYASEALTIETDKNVIWSMGIFSFD